MSFLFHKVRIDAEAAPRLITNKPSAALSSVTPAAQFLQSAQPELAGGASSSGAPVSCGGCYVVADVAGLVWYSEVFVNTAATAMVSVGAGSNGTQATRTSIVQNEGDFTFGPGLAPTGAALNQINYESSLTISGAVLQSPTAYNVFTAYSVTSATLSDGVCVTNSGPPIALTSAYTEVLSAANGKVVLDQNGEQQFIDFLGFKSCSAGGESIVPTALVQVTNVTATSTASNTGGPKIASTQSLSVALVSANTLAGELRHPTDHVFLLRSLLWPPVLPRVRHRAFCFHPHQHHSLWSAIRLSLPQPIRLPFLPSMEQSFPWPLQALHLQPTGIFPFRALRSHS